MKNEPPIEVWRADYHCKLVSNGRVVINDDGFRYGTKKDLTAALHNTRDMQITNLRFTSYTKTK